MPLETATFISDLVTTNPAHSDGLNNADAHIRLLKSVLKNTFGQLAVALVNATGDVLIPVDGTASAPGLAFTSEQTLGFFRPSAGIISFTGTLRGAGAMPAGAIQDFGMATPPTGWLACDGQAVSRTTFADLFAAIGTTWGAGDGSTTFNVPNLLSRFRRHRDNSTLAGAVGVLKSPANLAHSHGVNGVTGLENQGHTHDVQGSTGAMSANNVHSHTYNTPGLTTTGGGAFAAGGPGTPATTSAVDINHTHFFDVTSGAEQQNHNHNVNIQSGGGTADDPNEARPFSAAVLTCIKT